MENQHKNKSSASISKGRGGVLIMIILLVFIALAGFFVGRNLSQQRREAAGSGLEKYIILIHNENLRELGIQKTQNDEWIKTLSAERYVIGGQFSNNGWIFSPGPEGPYTEVKPEFLGSGNVSGYFIIEVKNEDEALKIAKTCPQLLQRGFLEMRKLN